MDSMSFVLRAIEVMAGLFVFVVGLGLLAILFMYVVDRTQR